MKKNIAVLMGGVSSEKEISLNSGRVVAQNLDRNKYNVYSINISKDRWYCMEYDLDIDKNDFSLLKEGKKIIFDAVYNTIHGSPGEDGKLQGYFEMLNIKHTSCDSFSSSVTFGKIESKSVLNNFEIPTANMVGIFFNDFNEDDIPKIIHSVGLPCFIKPNRSGSSFGVSKIYKEEDFKKALFNASKEDNQILVERFIRGTEVSVGITEIKGDLQILGITEIIPETDFFDYKAKYEGLSREITPAEISQTQIVESLTKKIYRILNLKGICRIDFIIEQNIPYFLEVNTVPGLSEQSIIPQQAKYSNISLIDLFDNEIIRVLK